MEFKNVERKSFNQPRLSWTAQTLCLHLNSEIGTASAYVLKKGISKRRKNLSFVLSFVINNFDKFDLMLNPAVFCTSDPHSRFIFRRLLWWLILECRCATIFLIFIYFNFQGQRWSRYGSRICSFVLLLC